MISQRIFQESQTMKNDTTRYPRTIVSFAIVARYWRRALGAARSSRAYLWPPISLYEDYIDNRLCRRLDYDRC